jgi:hypothetical protein
MRAIASRPIEFLALSWILLGLLTCVVSFFVSIFALPRPWAIVGFTVHLTSLLTPLRVPPPAWARRLLRYLTTATADYFPITVEFEDKDGFKSERPFVVGEEPPARAAPRQHRPACLRRCSLARRLRAALGVSDRGRHVPAACSWHAALPHQLIHGLHQLGEPACAESGGRLRRRSRLPTQLWLAC